MKIAPFAGGYTPTPMASPAAAETSEESTQDQITLSWTNRHTGTSLMAAGGGVIGAGIGVIPFVGQLAGGLGLLATATAVGAVGGYHLGTTASQVLFRGEEGQSKWKEPLQATFAVAGGVAGLLVGGYLGWNSLPASSSWETGSDLFARTTTMIACGAAGAMGTGLLSQLVE